LLMLAVALLVAVSATSASERQPAFVPVMRVGDVVPNTPLKDQLGRPLFLRGGSAPSIVSFAYTRCGDRRVCSLVTVKFRQLQELLRGTGVRLVELTLDPAYDRPPILRRFAAAAGADPASWLFGTGRPVELSDLSKRFGITRIDEKRGLLGHTETLAIVSGSGVLLTLVGGDDWAPKDVAAEARRDAGLGSNPIDRMALALFAGVGAACGVGGAGGISLLGTLAVFGTIVVSLGFFALRVCSIAFADRS
jgi:cytochrome oxidase Cu insertion factor (SCO1/SenC/PrrC family)